MTEKKRKRSALSYIKLYVGRPNYMWAENTNTSRDIRLTYEVSGLEHCPRRYNKDIPAGGAKELGIIDAGGGQILSYRKTGARFLN